VRITNKSLTDLLGFKSGIGCADVILSVETLVDYFVSRGSAMYASKLDLRKAIDSVSHCKFYNTLLDAGIPSPIVDNIKCWYNELFDNVRWNNQMYNTFHVSRGVRQGSLFIDVLIRELISLDVGFHIENRFNGCFLYAGDVIILSPSVCVIQSMLNACVIIFARIHLNFNLEKSFCMIFGRKSKVVITPMVLDNTCIPWLDSTLSRCLLNPISIVMRTELFDYCMIDTFSIKKS
jgi:Reverse transcriptase (RNA-dependent DNA polymerase)